MYPTVGVAAQSALPSGSVGSDARQSPVTAARGQSTTLSVHIAPPYRVAPPIRGPAHLPPASSSQGDQQQQQQQQGVQPPPPAGRPPADFEIDRKLLAQARAAAAAGGGTSSGSSGSSGEAALGDPLEASLAQYMSMGFTREEAGLALAVACTGGATADDVQAVAATARKLRTLSEMGFPRELVVGALVACKGDADRAADACIAAQGS